MRFSERLGISPVKSTIQIDSIDDDLRNGLWNALTIFYWDHVKTMNGLYKEYDSRMARLVQLIWLDYFKLPVDDIPFLWSRTCDALKNHFYHCEWYRVYDFVEFVWQRCRGDFGQQVQALSFVEYCNQILEREVSAYRFVGGRLARLTSKEEVAAVEEAMASADVMQPVAAHISAALALLADRKSPDYRNSIKESISAVEAVCKLLARDEKADLHTAIRKLRGSMGVHPALGKAFINMYGYTSDADGIRHALLDEPNLSFEDAKFMLVSCSAFVNYLVAKATKAEGKS